jgi:RimJ/RimL family protein N-acetyltransferase
VTTGVAIESPRLRLEPLTIEQGNALSVGDRGGQPWAPDFPTEGDLRQAEILRIKPERVVSSTNAWGPYTLIEKRTGLCVGGIGFKGPPDDDRAVEIGYGICASRQGLGLMSEAVERLCQLARSQGALRVTAETDVTNLASQRVLEKSGFTRDPVQKGPIWWRRELHQKMT